MKVVIDEEALDDLDGIHAWIARDTRLSADSTVERIYEEIEHLGRFPRLGHRGRARNTFEWVVSYSTHIVVYEIDASKDELAVIGVFRGSQQIRRS
jgi:toxin ParE1/3/4